MPSMPSSQTDLNRQLAASNDHDHDHDRDYDDYLWSYDCFHFDEGVYAHQLTHSDEYDCVVQSLAGFDS